ncbi:LacI family transcriptional regulator [Anoxybacter fermentans]|uniref:LacI family transcriptional regulator n=1 Tax=Anoxybacter fermentans TaxID=1323375 RepID=A0A3S9T205_9FIRM|nr:LacI family DNA-binding transcriptional regulator [Anoxybacter fermentans]AZR74591.1 LacI family transcriptional regulator [Anoxybacter fermentans]
MPLTMKDIARMVGVSESTVSRAINGKPGVGKETREKILALVKKYQYQPNTLAKGLASQKTRTLGLIIPDITYPYLTRIVKGIEERANELGYHLILANTGGNRDKEISYLSLFQQNRVEGIIFVGGSLAEEEIIKLGLNKYPLVLVNKLMEELALPTLLIDHQQGAELAITHLIERGHQRIGMVVGSLDDLTNFQLLEGYKEALKQSNLPFLKNMVVEVEDSRQGGYNGFLKLIEEENLPSAIFAASDLLAVGVVEAIKMGGYLIPDEIAVVGYGDTLITEIIHPPLTTIRLPLSELGKRAIDRLVKVIEKTKIEEPFEILTSKLIRRHST